MLKIFYFMVGLTGVGLAKIAILFKQEKRLTQQALEDEIRMTAFKWGIDLTENRYGQINCSRTV